MPREELRALRRLQREQDPSHMLRHACGLKLANDGVDTRTGCWLKSSRGSVGG